MVVFGMNDVGRTVADALESHGVPYDAVDGNYDRFLAASADGYPVAFGDLGDVRLMETLAYSERDGIVVTNVRYEEAEAMKPIIHDRYPNLTCFIAVDTDTDEVRFKMLGLRPVVNRSFPRGIDMAAVVLRSQNVDEAKIQEWMRRQQQRALQGAANGAAYAAG